MLIVIGFTGAAVGGGVVGYHLKRSSASSCKTNAPETALWQQLSLPGIVSHLQSLQTIATKNGGTRSISSPGFNASLTYVKKQLQDHTNLVLTVQPFSLNVSVALSPPFFSMLEPRDEQYTAKDFSVLEFSSSSEVTSTVVAANNNGCDQNDYPPSTAGKISLIARGGCLFFEKVDNAIRAGARGVLIFNLPDQIGPVDGTLYNPESVTVFSISNRLGQELLYTPNALLHMSYQSEVRTVYTANLIAETRSGTPDSIVTVGSHLDSAEGPGLNDNGSGSSAILQMALQFEDVVKKPVNKVRFIWYGAEEEGLVGSSFYVNSLTPSQRGKIVLNLNFNMLGSPNYIRGILNCSETKGGTLIMDTFAEFFDANSLAYQITPLDYSSDYSPYLNAGIPAGAIDTGAGRIKTAEERSRFGGILDIPFDPCYHQSCDTIDNVHTGVLHETAQAATYALEHFATIKSIRDYFSSK